MARSRDTSLMALAAVAMLLTPWVSAITRRNLPAPGQNPVRQTPATRPAGATANRPSEIPAGGWWNILKRVVTGFSQDRIMAEAAGVTFFGLLAIFPALAALVSLYGLVADPTQVASHINTLEGVIPGGGMDILNDQLKSLTKSGQGALSFGAIVGFATSLWSANAGMKAMFDALNAVYEERESRNWFHLTGLSLTFTMCSLIFTIMALTAVVVLPAVLNFVGFGWTTDLLLRVCRWPALLLVVTFFLAVLYRWGPSRAHARWRWLSWGGVFAAVTWVIASAAFSWYVASFGSYNKTYGSLGAAVGFMTWIWISTMIVLVGAELNAEMEQQTARDTTVGRAETDGPARRAQGG